MKEKKSIHGERTTQIEATFHQINDLDVANRKIRHSINPIYNNYL